jgi:hypothetical protein
LQYSDIAQIRISWIANKGIDVYFWIDRCLDNISLASKYSYLFSISNNPHTTVLEMLAPNVLTLSFNRQIVGIFYTE